jgi:beta-N-acetylhexosaminidase
MLESLTLEQVIGQKLLLAFAGKDQPPPEILESLRRFQPAGVTLYRPLNVDTPAQVRRLTQALQQAARNAGLPTLLIAADQEGGQLMAVGQGATQFPGNMALGATGSGDLARRCGEAIGRELAAMGINVNYAPVCDVLANLHNPVIGVRSFGGDASLVARLSAALVEGLQSAGVAATAKHFPGLGDTGIDAHFATPMIQHDSQRLHRVELRPFEAAIQAGVRILMVGHMAVPALSMSSDLPATFSPAILQGLLRQEMGFEGVITSDALDMRPVGQGLGLVIDAIAAAAAGVDLFLCGPTTRGWEAIVPGLVQAVRRGLLGAGELEASAGRVLALKRWLAGHEPPPLDFVGCAEHRDLALEIARRAVTLVRNTGGQVPLHLSPDERLLVILPRPVDLTPADTSSYLNPSLAEFLRPYHPATDEIIISINPSETEVTSLVERARAYDRIIAGTINALDHPGQAALVNQLLESGVSTTVVALRAPFDLLSFPSAPLYACTYSLQPPALQALAEALLGRIPFAGTLPVAIPGV